MAAVDKASGSGRASDKDLDEFVTTLKTQIEIFVNRMKSNSSRGRPIANDTSVQVKFCVFS
jgi:growth factor-regulated tyrosine kinase substrate